MWDLELEKKKKTSQADRIKYVLEKSSDSPPLPLIASTLFASHDNRCTVYLSHIKHLYPL
jgi:hypothetical protein